MIPAEEVVQDDVLKLRSCGSSSREMFVFLVQPLNVWLFSVPVAVFLSRLGMARRLSGSGGNSQAFGRELLYIAQALVLIFFRPARACLIAPELR